MTLKLLFYFNAKRSFCMLSHTHSCLFVFLSMQISNRPVTRQQLGAFEHWRQDRGDNAEVRTEHHNKKERWFKSRRCGCCFQMGWHEYFKNWSTEIIPHKQQDNKDKIRRENIKVSSGSLGNGVLLTPEVRAEQSERSRQAVAVSAAQVIKAHTSICSPDFAEQNKTFQWRANEARVKKWTSWGSLKKITWRSNYSTAPSLGEVHTCTRVNAQTSTICLILVQIQMDECVLRRECWENVAQIGCARITMAGMSFLDCTGSCFCP